MVNRRILILSLILLGILSVGVVSAQNADGRSLDCNADFQNTYVEQEVIDHNCLADYQQNMENHLADQDSPIYNLEDTTLNYGESTQVRVEILHEDPHVNYDCQVRTRNNGNQNPWTDFYEVERVAVTDEPTVITQTITAPDTTVTSQQSVEVQVEVYCYGPSNEEPYYASVFSDGWIAQGYWSSTLTYEYPTQEAISGQDLDNDGLTRAEEQEYGTNPSVADTDNDGLEDGEEVTRWNTDPTTSDTDGDGLDDGEEVNEYGTDPTDPHSDGDGLEDGEEVSRYDTNPTRTDTDGDGIDDGTEVEQGTDPTDPNDPPEEDDTTSEPEEDTNTESTTNPDSDNDNQVSESTSEDEDTGSSEEQFQRGFLTNNPDSSIAILNSPANLTAIGFFLSILGILLPMVKEG